MTITIPNYLLTRLSQLGVTSIFGVPGDFNLAFLDTIDDHPTISWRPCTNELNAAYAADGYSRTTHNLAVLCTTFGVGELSAVNGVAGAFSERIPILHIVGVPSTSMQAHKAILHHTLGDGRFDAYHNIYSHVSATTVLLTSPQGSGTGASAGEQIDVAITTALQTCRPTYITIPMDLVHQNIPSKLLETPLSPSPASLATEVSPKAEQLIIDQIVHLVKASKNPIVLIDACAKRFGVQDLCKELVEKTGFTFYTSPMGKGAIDENHPQFGGVYIGDVSLPHIRERVDNADLMISIGALKSDFNTGSFSYHATSEQNIELHSDHTRIQYAYYASAGFKSILPKLIKALEPHKALISESSKTSLQRHPIASPTTPPISPLSKSGSKITQDGFWKTWESFFRDGDIIIGETGTSAFGLLDIKFPPNVVWIAQILYGSIGYTTGAAFGAAIAAKEENKNRRTILFIGDGSLQVSVQELSSIVRHKLPVTIVLLNNAGYTIERLIHGKTRKYNDIQNWNWQQLLEVFDYNSPEKTKSKSYKVSTFEELVKLQHNELAAPNHDSPQLVEVVMDRLDGPRALRKQATMTSDANNA